MLIRFAVENFMSFRDMTKFSMSAGKVTKHGDHVAIQRGKRILKGSFLFGANAAGKSNLVYALDFASDIVKKGLNSVSCDKKYFRIDPEYKVKPGIFQFDLSSNGHFYSYGFAISYTSATVEEEWLYQIDNDTDICVFLRHKSEDSQTIVVDSDIPFSGERFRVYSEDITTPKMNQTLFLSDVVLRSPDNEPEYQAFRDVVDWFNKLIIIFPFSTYSGIMRLLDDDNRRTQMSGLLEHFDTGIVSVSKQEGDIEKIFSGFSGKSFEAFKAKLIEDLKDEKENSRGLVPYNDSLVEVRYSDGSLYASRVSTNHGNENDLFEFSDESDGTRRLFDLIPIFQSALSGRTIIVDELDRSLHTKATQEFIRYFYEVTEGIAAQLIVTTQDSNIMDLDFVRQDEIWFVERQADHSSKLYSLNQFKARFDKKVERAYLLGRYGAIPVFKQFPAMDNDDITEEETDDSNK